MSENVKQSNHRVSDGMAIAFAIGIPTLITLVYFQWLRDSDSSLQQIAYGVGKVVQFGFPVVYVWFRHREKLHHFVSGDRDASTAWIWFGAIFGLAVSASMFAIYFVLLDETEIAVRLRSMVTEKVTSIGVDTVWKYAALGIFYALCHSFLEEYYWRWFVFDLLRMQTSTWSANLVSSLGFMAHHVILLGFFFGWTSPLTYLFSIGVAIGGSFWAWLYQHENSLRSAWISHMIVDAGIFSLGYFLVFAAA